MTTWKTASALILGTLTLSSCYEDDPKEAPVAVEISVEDLVQLQPPLASLEAGDPFVLLTTTLSGKLLEIDVAGESVRLIGETEQVDRDVSSLSLFGHARTLVGPTNGAMFRWRRRKCLPILKH